MVIGARALVPLILLFLLLLMLAGCGDVPLDAVTAIRDTISEPVQPGTDTVPTPNPNPTPTPAPSTVTLFFKGRSVPGPGGDRRGKLMFTVAPEITIDSVLDGV